MTPPGGPRGLPGGEDTEGGLTGEQATAGMKTEGYGDEGPRARLKVTYPKSNHSFFVTNRNSILFRVASSLTGNTLPRISYSPGDHVTRSGLMRCK